MIKTDFIIRYIDRLPKGYIFTYLDFIDKVNNKETVIKILNRLAASGKIAKFSKGKYYKPEKSLFGKLQPERYQIVKDLLEEDGKITGYLTGYSIFNELGLTTQISNIIQIGKNNIRPGFNRAGYKISFILQKNLIIKKNIPLLQILDSVRYIKKIPDTTISSAIKRLKEIIRNLSKENRILLARLALKYPPATRAILGAILEETGNISLTESLSKSLNPITTYNLLLEEKTLSSADNWNIK